MVVVIVIVKYENCQLSLFQTQNHLTLFVIGTPLNRLTMTIIHSQRQQRMTQPMTPPLKVSFSFCYLNLNLLTTT
jgi:hypothetical protein